MLVICTFFILYCWNLYCFYEKGHSAGKNLWGKKKSRGLFFAIAEYFFSTDLWALGTQQKFDLRVFWANFFIIWKPNGFLKVIEPNWWIFHSEKLHRVQPQKKTNKLVFHFQLENFFWKFYFNSSETRLFIYKWVEWNKYKLP